MTDSYDVVLVGGGPSTRILNKFLHQLLLDVRTVVIRDENRIVNHCGTPYIVEGEIPWQKGLIPEKLVEQFDTEILVDPVVGGDPVAHEVELASGRVLRYRQLVFATGTDQITPPIPGFDLDGVLKVRRTVDVERAMQALSGVDDVVVLGGGYIGLEFAVSLANMGKRVSLVEMLDRVMGDRIDLAMAAAIEEHLRARGIDLRTGVAASRILGDAGHVTGVELADGSKIHADAVIPSVGVRPIVDFASRLGLETDTDGLVVDDHFRTSQPDVYAIGDCVGTRCAITGRRINGKLGSNAGRMARTLALQLSGLDDRPFPGIVNVAATVLGGLAYGSAGLTERDAHDAGIEVHTVRAQATHTYDNMPHPHPVDIKMTYRADDLRVLGGELLGRFNPAGHLEALGQMIERGARLFDVVGASYCSHPELTPKTSHPYWTFASEKLLFRLQSEKELATTAPVGSGE